MGPRFRYGMAALTWAAIMCQLCRATASRAEDGPLRCRPDAEKAAIVGGSAVLGLGVSLIHEKPSDPASYVGYRASALDVWWRTALHGGRERKSNFLDHTIGSLLTPVAGGIAIAGLDIDRREFSYDIPLFIAGAVTTGAVTDAAKKVVTRPRPYCQTEALVPPDRAPTDPYHTESFFSGHTSQAFFTAGFVNNRLRRHMRQEWTPSEYRSWRWASPLVSYGWATFVGMSRIQADKHHFTDVAAGALAGFAMSEIFYRLGYDSNNDDEGATTSPTVLMLRFSF